MTKIRVCFDKFIRCFLEEVLAVDNGFWPLPPMLGDGTNVDLLKLFLVVRERGGYDAVSVKGLWDVVAEESGLGLHRASSVKLVYTKYLGAAERWLGKVVDDKESASQLSDSGSNAGCFLTELGVSFKGVLSEVADAKCLEMKSSFNFSVGAEFDGNRLPLVDDEESMQMDSRKSVIGSVKVGELANDGVEIATVVGSRKRGKNCNDLCKNLLSDLKDSEDACNNNDMKSVVMETNEGKECHNDNVKGNEDDTTELDSTAVGEPTPCRKRDRESVHRTLSWVTGIARNPCDPVVTSLPEMSKWKSYGHEESWKQVLLVREALFLKRQVDSPTGQSSWKKNQKMHPFMYEENFGSSYNLRKKLKSGDTSYEEQGCSQSCFAATQTCIGSCAGESRDCDSSNNDSVLDLPRTKQIPLGPSFQAEIPTWTGVASEDQLKWMGNRVWPQKTIKRGFIIERDPIGKGRQDSCGCQVPTSTECVRFHCAERKVKLMRELGAAFYHWRFDKMGEEVKLSWKEEEEKKFKAIARSNTSALGNYFWNEIVKAFRNKRREDLVSYYYNVYLLQRRAYQNRFTPLEIYSDDEDESEWESATNGSGQVAVKSPASILKSAKKTPKNL